MEISKTVVLLLQDGRFFYGEKFGSDGETIGEVCFNTGMTGYQEILTDPSYCQQIVTMTVPHIGNYGVNPDDYESDRIQVAGFVVKEATEIPSNWRSTQSLGDYLKDQLPEHPNHPKGRNPYAHVALEIKNKFQNSYKDLPDTKFQEIKDYIEIIKNNPS